MVNIFAKLMRLLRDRNDGSFKMGLITQIYECGRSIGRGATYLRLTVENNKNTQHDYDDE